PSPPRGGRSTRASTGWGRPGRFSLPAPGRAVDASVDRVGAARRKTGATESTGSTSGAGYGAAPARPLRGPPPRGGEGEKLSRQGRHRGGVRAGPARPLRGPPPRGGEGEKRVDRVD